MFSRDLIGITFLSTPAVAQLHQGAIRRCAKNDGCNSASAIPEIRTRVAELVRKGLAQPSASKPAAARGYGVSAGVPANGAVSDETLDHLFLWTSGAGDAELQGEPGLPRECCRGTCTDERAGVVGEESCRCTAASPKNVEERWEGMVRGEARKCGLNRGEGSLEHPEGGAAWCGTDGRGVGAEAEFARFEEEAGSLGSRGGGVGEDRFSAEQRLAFESGGTTSDRKTLTVVFALYGWKVDETEALLQVRRKDPPLWLWLCLLVFSCWRPAPPAPYP